MAKIVKINKKATQRISTSANKTIRPIVSGILRPGEKAQAWGNGVGSRVIHGELAVSVS